MRKVNLNVLNRKANLQEQEIQRLKSAINLQQNTIVFLESKLEEECISKNKAINRLTAFRKQTNRFHNEIIKDCLRALTAGIVLGFVAIIASVLK